MKNHFRGRACSRTSLLLAGCFAVGGCATSGQGSYESLRSEIDRTAFVSPHARAEDDRGLDGPFLERAVFVRAVLQRNPTVDAARSAWRGAVARVRQSGSLEDPTVDLGLAPLSVGASNVPLGYSAAISQRLPWPGKLSLDAEMARAEANAAKSDFESTRRELALTAALLYDQYFASVRSLEINAHHIVLLGEMKTAALAQFETGRASAQDPLQAEVEVTHMEHDAVKLAADRDVAVAQMNELLHRDPERPLPPPTKELVLAGVPDLGAAKRLGDEAAAKRPEIEGARLHAQAEQLRGERASRELYPDVVVSTSYNSMWSDPEHRWMVGLGFNLPIQRGRRAGGVEEADAMRSRYESEAARMTDKARAEVTVSLRRLDEAHHILRLFEQRLLPVARDQIDAARAGFITSRNDFVALIGAEKNLRDVELGYQLARADVDRRHAELDRALGRMPGLDEKEVSR
jgi:cobalt-zinc-cadmium efflux system outer membrane protein